jgi:hypothetical protein
VEGQPLLVLREAAAGHVNLGRVRVRVRVGVGVSVSVGVRVRVGVSVGSGLGLGLGLGLGRGHVDLDVRVGPALVRVQVMAEGVHALVHEARDTEHVEEEPGSG